MNYEKTLKRERIRAAHQTRANKAEAPFESMRLRTSSEIHRERLHNVTKKSSIGEIIYEDPTQ